MNVLNEHGNRLAKNILIGALIFVSSCEHIQKKQAETKLQTRQLLK